MPVDRTDLEARIRAASPQDTVRGLIFNALFDAVEEHLGKPAALALDPQQKGHRTDFFSYPVADFLRLAGAAADALEPRLGSTGEGLFRIGYRSVSNVFGSGVGATMLALSGKDVRRLLGQTASGYRATVSYGERKLEWVGERHARFHFQRDFLLPRFHEGVFTAALDAVEAKEPKVEGRQVGPLEAVYDLRWA